MKHISCLYRDGLSPAHSQPVSPPLDPNGISGPHVLQQDLPALPKEAAVVAGQGPKDIPETVAQAGAAASKVIGLLAKDKLVGNPCVAHSNELLCNGCSTCENVCPYGAIEYIDKEINDHGRREVRRIALVNEAVCQGCGACTVACPSGAMDLKGFSNQQIMAEVDAICKP